MTRPATAPVRTRAEVKAQAHALTGRPALKAVAAVDDEQEAPTPDGTVGELWLYGVVGGWWRGFDAESVSNAIRGLDVDVLYVRIHSPGGHAADGVAIGNLLRNHRAKIVVVVDGIAASAASVIAIAGDEVVMCPGSQMMLHDASTYAYGNAADLQEVVDWIDGQSQNYAGVYAYKAGGTPDQWRDVMRAKNGWGTWYTAEDTVTAGLADSVGTRPAIGSPPVAPEDELDDDEMWAKAAHDLELLEQCVHPAARAAWLGQHPPKPPTASAGGSTTPEKEGATLVDLTDEQIATLREQVGFPENADAGTITAAIAEALNERAETPSSAARPPEGQRLVSEAEWSEMRGNAERGAAAARTLHERDREAALNNFRDRFVPANRDSWRAEYDRNPQATVDALKALPVILPTAELGHEVDAEDGEGQTLDDIRNTPAYTNWRM